MYKFWTKEEDSIIIDNWQKTKTAKNIIPLLPHRTYTSLKIRVNNLGLKKINHYKDENFFEIPNLINSYWAAMLATDGHLRLPGKNKGYTIKLKLQMGDKPHLEKLLIDAKSDNKIYDYIYHVILRHKKYKNPTNKITIAKSSTIVFTHGQKWIEDLYKNWGIPAKNKTFDLKQPNITDFDQCLAYIKGLLDGDGTIRISHAIKKGVDYQSLQLNFLGTEDLLLWVKEFTNKFLNFNQRNNAQVKNG